MANNTFLFSNYDFSGIKDAITRMVEITRPIMETLQNFQNIIRPLVETAQLYSLNFNEISRSLQQFARNLSAIYRLGDSQFVYWDYLPPEFVDKIVDSQNINKTLREVLLKDKFKSVNKTVELTLLFPEMERFKRIYYQSVKAFQNGDCDLAVTGFTAVFDGLLSKLSNNPAASLKPRIKNIIEKLEHDELLDNEEYATLILSVTLEKTLESFSANSDFSGKEPKGLNRHWIAHGRSTRKNTKLDCVKMINLIYGLLLIGKISSTE